MVPKTEIDRWVHLCVEHLQDHAMHYLTLIQSKRVDGVLWAVFQAIDSNDPSTSVELHKASFLALSSMVSSKADVLLRMLSDCDPKRQFVCWFTLDDGRGNALASKVLTIDSGDLIEDPVATSSHLLSRQDREQLRQPSPPNAAYVSDTVMLMPHQQKNYEPRNPPQKKATVEEPVAPRSSSPKSVRDLLAAVARQTLTKGTPKQPVQPSASPQQVAEDPSSNPSTSMLMRMVMQVADSVASMGAAIDQLSVRCGDIEKSVGTLADRVHALEVPMFGSDYSFTPANDTKRTTHSTQANGRSLMSASEMLMQITEVSLRLGETENRVRVLESHRDSSDKQRQLLYEQVEGFKARLQDVSQQQLLAAQHATSHNAAAVSHRHVPSSQPNRMTEHHEDSSASYPWRQERTQLKDSTRDNQGNPHPTSSRHSGHPPAEPLSTHASPSSSISAAVRMMDSPMKGYTPPLTTRGRSQQDAVPVNTSVSHMSQSHHMDDDMTDASSVASSSIRKGPLTDMIRSLEVKLGGLRSNR